MAELNQFACNEAFGNTGVAKCAFIPSAIKAVLIVSSSFVITQANATAGLTQFLQDATVTPSKSARLFPIKDLIDSTDNSEEPVIETTGYGVPVPLRDGNYIWNFRFLKGGVCLLSQLRKFNNQSVSVLFVDENGVIFGRKTAEGLKGVPMISFYAGKWTLPTGTTATNMSFTVTFEPKYLLDQLGFIKDDDFSVADINGLQDLLITPVGAQTGTALNVSVTTACGGENIYDLYKDELASGTLWDVVNKDTGAALVVDSVAGNDVTKTFTLTLDPARTTAVVVNLKPVDILDAANVVGFEGVATEIPAP